MKPLTEKQRQWLWFTALWTGGLVTALTLSSIIRFMISLARP